MRENGLLPNAATYVNLTNNTERKKSISCMFPLMDSFEKSRASQESSYFWETERVTGREGRKALATLGTVS